MSLRPPSIDCAVNYSYTIICNGIEVGTLQRLTKSGERQHLLVQEIRNTSQNAQEILPGRAVYTLEAERIRTYMQSILVAFGFVFSSLGDITTPVHIFERVSVPPGIGSNKFSSKDWLNPLAKSIPQLAGADWTGKVYMNCFPIRWTETVALDRILVTESATFACLDIIDLSVAEMGNLALGGLSALKGLI